MLKYKILKYKISKVVCPKFEQIMRQGKQTSCKGIPIKYQTRQVLFSSYSELALPGI